MLLRSDVAEIDLGNSGFLIWIDVPYWEATQLGAY